jgi:hypothetical protein
VLAWIADCKTNINLIVMSTNQEFKEENKFIKGWIIWLVMLAFLIGGVIWFFNRAEQTIDTAIIKYEEFQDIYNTCNKINTDICNMREMPDNDKSFEQFSKPQRINALKTNLNRWVEQYNANSKKWNHSLWKSKELPYQLDVNQFNCYNEPLNTK